MTIIVLTVLALVLMAVIVRPFASALFVAAVLAGALQPWYERFARRVGGRQARAHLGMVHLVLWPLVGHAARPSGDAAIGTGIAVDKMLALTGQTPTVQIANIVMPSEEERAERRAIDAKLNAIARRLMESRERKP